MGIFYIRKDKFLTKIDKKSLEKFSDGRVYNSEEKYYEHLCGLFLVKFVAKFFYNLKDTTIILKDKKPIFKNSNLHFSISHSENIIIVGFSDVPIGVDVEFMKFRNFEKVMSRYKKLDKIPTKEEFYNFWTKHEAEIKLGTKSSFTLTTKFEQDYMLTYVSANSAISNFKIKELKVKETEINIDLEKEFHNQRCLEL